MEDCREYLLAELEAYVESDLFSIRFSQPVTPLEVQSPYRFFMFPDRAITGYFSNTMGAETFPAGCAVYGIDSAQNRRVHADWPLRTLILGIYPDSLFCLCEFSFDEKRRAGCKRYLSPALLPYRCRELLDLLDRAALHGEFRRPTNDLARGLLRIACELIRCDDGAAANSKPEKLWNGIVTHLHRNPTQDLSSHIIAEHFDITGCYLNILCRQQTGKTFTDFVRGVRIARAMELLRGGMEVKAVSDACGYCSIPYFSRCFKNIAGMPPGVWRARTAR